jgi:hypothetical protein
MYTGEAAPDCNEADGANGWVAITDRGSMNITVFTVDDALSYTEVVLQDVNGNTMSQKVRKLRMAIRGALVADPTIVRRVEDIISVRNDLIF